MSEKSQGRVLVVDDDSRNIRLLETILKPAGYAVATADSGLAALEQVERAPPDLVLLDVMMPGMDGFEVVRRLKSAEATKTIPVIMLTALDDRDSRLHALNAGAEDFLIKPVDRSELLLRVKNLLKLKEYQNFLADHNRILEEQVQARTAALVEKEERLRIATQKELETGAERLLIMENIPALIASFDKEGRYLFANRNYVEFFRPTADTITGKSVAEVVGAEVWRGIQADIERACSGERVRYQRVHRRADGGVRHIAVSLIPNCDEAGQVRAVYTLIIDISERVAHEERIGRLSRIRAVSSGINSAIVRERERQPLLEEVCRIAVSEGGFILARVIEQDSNARARIAATSETDSRLYQRILDDYNSDPEHSQSLLALALRGGQPLISNDVAADARIFDRAALTKDGNYSLAQLPMVVEKRVAGVLTLRAREARMFDEDELRLLLELVSNVSFALELMDKQKKLDYLAYYDALTGLANRNLFHERLTQYLHTGKQAQGKLALALMDVERFKWINDTLGRQAGDELLKQLAGRLAHAASSADIARIGGDHFAIVVPEIKGRSEIGRNLERIWRECFAQPFLVNNTELRVSAKAGIALFPSDGDNADVLFAHAEAALQKAQQTGERLQFHSRDMTERVAGQLALENQLRQALEKEEFVLHYQPKVELDTGRIVGVEALIRWQSPGLGLVPPMKFIPLMEETGLILPVGSWALKQASLDHRKWFDLGLKAPRVAVNVSAIQLRQRDFVGAVEQAIIEGIAPTGIDLEITESLIMEDIQGNIEKLKVIRGLGLRVAIDDFGTGYSSLAYLAKLPVQTLKIDRSFIITMLNDPDTMILVQTIISLAHALRLKVVAEGVDQEEQAKMLRLLRCDEMQGYLFSKPVPFEQMTALLKSGKPA